MLCLQGMMGPGEIHFFGCGVKKTHSVEVVSCGVRSIGYDPSGIKEGYGKSHDYTSNSRCIGKY